MEKTSNKNALKRGSFKYDTLDAIIMLTTGSLLYQTCGFYVSYILKGKNFPVTKLKVTSRKSVSKKLVSMVIDSPSFLNKAVIFFLILSSTCPVLLLIAASPSYL